jgi:hypothetical protein
MSGIIVPERNTPSALARLSTADLAKRGLTPFQHYCFQQAKVITLQQGPAQRAARLTALKAALPVDGNNFPDSRAVDLNALDSCLYSVAGMSQDAAEALGHSEACTTSQSNGKARQPPLMEAWLMMPGPHHHAYRHFSRGISRDLGVHARELSNISPSKNSTRSAKDPAWPTVRERIMEDVMRSKFASTPRLQRLLVSTYPATLVFAVSGRMPQVGEDALWSAQQIHLEPLDLHAAVPEMAVGQDHLTAARVRTTAAWAASALKAALQSQAQGADDPEVIAELESLQGQLTASLESLGEDCPEVGLALSESALRATTGSGPLDGAKSDKRSNNAWHVMSSIKPTCPMAPDHAPVGSLLQRDTAPNSRPGSLWAPQHVEAVAQRLAFQRLRRRGMQYNRHERSAEKQQLLDAQRRVRAAKQLPQAFEPPRGADAATDADANAASEQLELTAQCGVEAGSIIDPADVKWVQSLGVAARHSLAQQAIAEGRAQCSATHDAKVAPHK